MRDEPRHSSTNESGPDCLGGEDCDERSEEMVDRDLAGQEEGRDAEAEDEDETIFPQSPSDLRHIVHHRSPSSVVPCPVSSANC